jgi:MFS family permease
MVLFADVSFGDNLMDWLWIVGGVLIAVLLPVLTALVQAQFKPQAAELDFGKYAALFGFAAMTAIILLAGYRVAEPDTNMEWYAGLLTGYAWEATLEKLRGVV